MQICIRLAAAQPRLQLGVRNSIPVIYKRRSVYFEPYAVIVYGRGKSITCFDGLRKVSMHFTSLRLVACFQSLWLKWGRFD